MLPPAIKLVVLKEGYPHEAIPLRKARAARRNGDRCGHIHYHDRHSGTCRGRIKIPRQQFAQQQPVASFATPGLGPAPVNAAPGPSNDFASACRPCTRT